MTRKNLKPFIAVMTLFLLAGCEESDPLLPPDDSDTVMDIDGNIYDIIQIGSQWWMIDNLRTSRYSNGDAIPSHLGGDEWESTTSGAYAVYPHGLVDGVDSEEEMLAAYGALYNWYAVADSRGLCPTGWRVPGDAEWKQLEMYLGMSQEEADSTNNRGIEVGGRMKATETDPDPHPRWRHPNTGATNESGWSGLPGGYRLPDGSLPVGLGFIGYWWSSMEYDSDTAWNRSIYYDFGFVYRFSHSKSFGFSVRCVRE